MDYCTYKYFKEKKCFFIKISGRATYDTCDGFKDFIDKITSDNLHIGILIDLTETEYLDSTNLGLLEKFAVHHFEKNDTKATILSTNKNVTQTILNTGLEQIFSIVDSKNNKEVNWDKINSEKFRNNEKLTQTLLETHQILMNLNEKNKLEFADVVNLLKNNNPEEPS